MKPYYDDGKGIQIYHADCREVLPSLPQVDLVLTDPPYGIALENHGRFDGHRKNRSWEIVGDDDMAAGQYVVDWAMASKIPLVVFASPERPWSGNWRSLLVWHKYGLGMGGDPSTCWRRDWELVQVANNGGLDGGRDSAVIIGHTIRPSEFVHPCQKPESLLRYLILKVGGDMVLDPFCGSGSTLIAAKMEGRSAIGCEIDEHWCEVSANRLAQGVLEFKE